MNFVASRHVKSRLTRMSDFSIQVAYLARLKSFALNDISVKNRFTTAAFTAIVNRFPVTILELEFEATLPPLTPQIRQLLRCCDQSLLQRLPHTSGRTYRSG